jgi:PAS domain S-box-containing protein
MSERPTVAGSGQPGTTFSPQGPEAETALRESEERFRRVFDEGPLGVAIVDLDARIQRANPRLCQMLGYSEREIIELGIEGITRPEDWEKNRQPVSRLVHGEIKGYCTEKRYLHQDGSVIWAQLTASLMTDIEGKPTAIIALVEDITERKRTEEILRRSQQKMRLHVQQTPLAVIEWDLEHRVTDWNPGAQRIFGYTEKEALGREFSFLVLPAAREHVDHLWNALLAKKGGERSTNENITKDGNTILCEWYNTPLVNADGQIIGIACLVEDITERKRAEADLRVAKEFAESLIASMLDGFSVLDTQGVHSQVNDAFCRMTGFSRDELIGTGLPHPYWPPEHVDNIEESLRRVARGDVEQFELVFMRKNGERFPVIVAPSSVKDEHGTVINYFATIKDITERKRAEAALRASEAKYRRLYQSMRDGFVSVRMDGHLQEFNDAYCQMLGYAPDELHERTYQDLTPSRWQEFEAGIVRDQVLTRGYSDTYEKEYRRKDGTIFPVVLRTYLIRDDRGQPSAMWAIIRDITERKRTEAALKRSHDELERRVEERTAELAQSNESLRAEIQERQRTEKELSQSEAKYKALVESSPDAILMCDLEGRIMFASSRAAEQHACDDARELVGRPATDLVVPEDRDILKENIRRVVQEGLRRNDQYQGLRCDGTTFFSEASAAVIRSARGEPEAFTAVYQDITDRKRAQDALQKERDALRRMLQASDHDREMITFEIHDGVAQRLLGALLQFEAYDRQAEHESEQLKAVFEAGLQALREASAEARSLMNRTRTPVLQKFGIKAALADFIDNISERPHAPEITYRCEVEFRRLAPVIENAIFRVAQEAITNACLHSKSELVRVSLVQDGEEVTLEVQDYGIGFDPATVAPGRFGLDGMRERSRLFGKELQLESTPGQGTRIRATFPVIASDD